MPMGPPRFFGPQAAISTALAAYSSTQRYQPGGAQAMSVRLNHGEVDLGGVHEINVTPFIDVILVLLIIFMIAAPLATVDVAVDLPASNAQRQPRPDKPLYLTVRSDFSLAIGDDIVAREVVAAALDQASGGDRQQR